jgi:hypothetical protein
MTAPSVELTPTGPTAPAAAATRPRIAVPGSLPTYRLKLMRVGYLLMDLGLAVVKWPLIPDAASLPVFEGVVAALLTAMSLLAFLGLRYPVQMLPLLLFDSLWKSIWLVSVAIPHLIAGDMDAAMSSVLFSVSLVVVILAVVPWITSGGAMSKPLATRGADASR